MAALREAGSGVCVVRTVTGLRGVGKTQLAAAYARDRRQADWRLVAWVNAETTPAILDGLAVVADRLGIETGGPDPGGSRPRGPQPAGGRRRALPDRLRQRDRPRRDHALRPVHRRPPGADHQHRVGRDAPWASPVQVEVFTEEEALAFLAARTRLDDQAGARSLATELGSLPLALAQAAAVIAARHLTYPVYLDRLRAYPAERYLPAARGEPYPRGVAEAIGLSIDTVTAAGWRRHGAASRPRAPVPRAAVGHLPALARRRPP